MKRIAVFGSTGSIGIQTLDIIQRYPESFRLVGVFANQNAELLREQVQKFAVPFAGLFEEKAHARFVQNPPRGCLVVQPEQECDCVLEACDTVVVCVAGFAGIYITLEALRRRLQVATATKEVLVAAGEIVDDYLLQYGGSLVPIDSEHSAVWQCLQGICPEGHYRDRVRRILLTASGGPFRTWTKEQMEHVTVEQAPQHPNWSMGAKITVDSATMMNKGLEVIEAQRLYKFPAEQIDILVHPQSIVHSMVECVDGSVIAQMGRADMRHPILYALTYPQRLESSFGSLDFTKLPPLTFEEPSRDRFPCIQLAYDALKMGGVAPAVLNGANEKAVQLFLEGKIHFPEIYEFVKKKLQEIKPMQKKCTLEDIIKADKMARME